MADSPHSFHIPVMGTGFTIDTPLRVAKYGINSVISLVDDVLIEQMRKFYCQKFNRPYQAITQRDPDARAKRITAYLDLLDELIKQQITKLKATAFKAGSEITRYYEMLPDSPLKNLYQKMLQTHDHKQKLALQQTLRDKVTAGRIDVNIMTKLDADKYVKGQKVSGDFSDALAALRGFANSKLRASVVFSAGFNPRLYGYVAQFRDFLPNRLGELKKQIILKVSDFRSAIIQGKYLAKRGVWVSEFRVESAINCGGHAFISDGLLLGPILEEFNNKKAELIATLHNFYQKALGIAATKQAPTVQLTVQGGIGTSYEHNFLLNKYQVNAVGWGTPFMLVPDAVNLDQQHLTKLAAATSHNVQLSDCSPLNVQFWNLTNSASELTRQQRIRDGRPGAPCVKGYAKLSTEFTELPMCLASHNYQRLKLQQLGDANDRKTNALRQQILGKACLCHDLAANATKKYGIDSKATAAVTCGPNIENFSKVASLSEMLDHIYGRSSLLTNKQRAHMFIKELALNIEFLQQELKKITLDISTRSKQKLAEIKDNLNQGIEYYRDLSKELLAEQQQAFIKQLQQLQLELNAISL